MADERDLRDLSWSLSLVNEMARLGVIENTVMDRRRFFDAAMTVLDSARQSPPVPNKGGR
jgi:hypothetical protein